MGERWEGRGTSSGDIVAVAVKVIAGVVIEGGTCCARVAMAML